MAAEAAVLLIILTMVLVEVVLVNIIDIHNLLILQLLLQWQ